jgi:hypothetical protein
MATLDSLLVRIDASTELLRRELQKGGAAVDNFAKNADSRVGAVEARFKKFGGALRGALASFGVGFSVAAIANFTRNAAQAADAIGETAKAAGFGAERFQRLSFVFGQNGVEAKEFEAAMRAANTRLGQFLVTGAGPAAKAIEQLGLKQRIANGEIRTGEQFVDASIDSLRKVGSAAERAALAAALFGREIGSKMAGALAGSKEEFEAAAAAASGIFSAETIRKADDLADAWERISKAAGNWAKSVAIGAAHEIGQAVGIDELQPKTSDDRLAQLRRLRQNLLAQNLTLDPAEARELAELEKSAAARGRFKTGGVFGVGIGDGPVGDGLQDVKVTAQRREAMRSMPVSPFSDKGLSEIRVPDRIRMPSDLKKLTPEFNKAVESLRQYNDELSETEQRQEQLWQTLGHGLQSALSSAFRGGRMSFKDFLKDMLADLLASNLTKRLMALFQGGSGAGKGIASFLGFAGGGRPPVGRPSWVGERGPELFVPDMPGRIYSNRQSMAMSGGTTVNVYNENHIETPVAPSIDAQLSIYGHAIAAKTYEAVMARMAGKR